MFLSPLGIPLTLLQVGVHPMHTVSPLLAANNFLLGSAIYDADRLDSNSTVDSRWVSRGSTLASMLVYASDSSTLWLAPIVLALHLGYANFKPSIGPIKPFFVACFWTIAVYYAPLWWSTADQDVFTPAAFFLHIAALSHAADIEDVRDDAEDGIITPAVTMGTTADAYTIATSLGACFMHALSPVCSRAYDALFLSIVGFSILARIQRGSSNDEAG